PFYSASVAPPDATLASSASLARYDRRPPLRRISRLTVQGARASEHAIMRADIPAITPREISSRSAKASARCERRRGGGGANATGSRQNAADRRMVTLEEPSDRVQGLALTPAFPHQRL